MGKSERTKKEQRGKPGISAPAVQDIEHDHDHEPDLSEGLQKKPNAIGHIDGDSGDLAAAGISALLLDGELRLQRYSAGTKGPFFLTLADLGQSIKNIKHKLRYEDISRDAEQVLKSKRPIERQVEDTGGCSFLARMHPYEARENQSAGVLLTFVDVTDLFQHYMAERKRAEEQLRELSQRLTYHVDNSPLAFIEWGPDMRLVRWSTAAERMFGWKAEEVLGKRMTDFRWIYDEDVPQVSEVSSDLRTGTDPGRFSANRNYRKDGAVLDCEWYNSSLVDENGNLRSILSLVLDVTDRKHAEEALLESRHKYQDLIETTGDFIWETDNQGRYTYCSPQMKALWGLEPADMIGRTPFDVMPPEDQEAGLQHFRQLADAALPFKDLTTRAMNGQGDLIFIETSGVPFFDRSGRLLGYRGITRDITERQRVELQLEQTNQRIQGILESIQDDFYVLDHEWKFVYASRLFTSRIGLEPHDFVGNSIWQMFPKHAGTILEENFRASMEKREVRRFEVGGRYTPAWYRMTSFPSAEGITVLGTDITEQKRAEEALQENQKQLALLNETLEQRVREQTAELRRLASDLSKAEHQERHRISHILHDDLQQRLYAIQMQVEFLRQSQTVQDNELQGELTQVAEQLAEILAITRHLSIDLSPPVLPNEGLAQAIRWLAGQMHEQHGLNVELHAPGSFALQDEAMQVLLFNCVRELLFNIVKHAGVNGAVVELKWIDDRLQIEVCDQGQGFPASKLRTANSGTQETNDESQTSFGLPTILHRLSLFGGDMQIKSEPGAGAQVILTIPIEEKRPAKQEETPGTD
jgi:PAS domain S-box-containing protein